MSAAPSWPGRGSGWRADVERLRPPIGPPRGGPPAGPGPAGLTRAPAGRGTRSCHRTTRRRLREASQHVRQWSPARGPASFTPPPTRFET
eukprot:9382792-Pyramimonas_sp.AAC.1